MDVTTLRIAATLLAFVTFLGILIWTFQPRNDKGFDEAARLPFEQD